MLRGTGGSILEAAMLSELSALNRRQQGAWATGDFHRVGVAQVVVGELLVRSLHVHAGEKVLDVAGGAGNTALAAARRWAEATCADYVPALLERAETRANAEGLPLTTMVADAQDLPFPDASFDVVTSTFGAMFAPDQQQTARELLRVLRPGGQLGMANWTPEGWAGRQFGLAATYAPPPPGLRPPSAWGTEQRLGELFGDGVSNLSVERRYADITHHDAESLFEWFRTWFGPVATMYASLEEGPREQFARDWIALAQECNVAVDGTCEIPTEYLEVITVKA